MNIKQLKEKIENLPDHMDVFIRQDNPEFNCSMVEKAKVINASFAEDEGGPVLAKDKIFLLTDQI